MTRCGRLFCPFCWSTGHRSPLLKTVGEVFYLGLPGKKMARTKGTALFGGRVGLPSPVGQRLAIQAA